MELRRKLEILADAAKYDASCASSGGQRKRPAGGMGNAEGMGLCHAYTPDGRCVSLLKVLLTNACIYDCQYCVNRISSDTPRAAFEPEEVVRLTLDFYRRNFIEGLFLSSGIVKSPDATMERMVAVASSLRVEHRFGGYIHLKVIAGASPELLRQAGAYADRLSANVELPTEADLKRLAPEKNLASVDRAMSVIRTSADDAREERRYSEKAPAFAPAGQSTQMIVGATDTADADVIATSERLYTEHALRRVYYSAYSPIPRSSPRLPARPIAAVREHRLYQADWLLRHYGFHAAELLSRGENLSLEFDPKTTWALRHRENFPVHVETAPREALLRIPGVGVSSVSRLLRSRRHGRIRLADLSRLGVSVNRARYFVVTADHNPALTELDGPGLAARLAAPEGGAAPEQLRLFA